MPSLSPNLRRAALALALVATTLSAQAWGPGGHQTVGAVADALLAGTPTAAKVKALLGGSLQGVATWADCARSVKLDADGWHYHAVDDQGHTHPECAAFETDAGQAALVDFVKRNASRCGAFAGYAQCRHEAYHFVDLSIARSAYDPAAPGTGPTDLVHAVHAAISVLQGGKATAPISIRDKREALRLLAHYVGDLHQPLHVGVLYLDAAGHATDPADAAQAKAESTSGGNALDFEGGELHRAWDSVTSTQMATLKSPAGIAAARAVPTTPGDVAAWPEAWATDTLAASKHAFQGLKTGPRQGRNWPATADEPGYRHDREGLQTQQMQKAAARLAQLLKALLP